jgi:formate hydrogenlyase transcriptional activator
MPARPPTEGTRAETHRHRILLEINNALISNLTREALFHAIAQAVRRVVPFERTAIFLHDAEKDVLKLFILESSLPSSYFTVGLEMAPGESHVGLVFQRQEPFLRRDLATERQYPAEDLAYGDGVRSYVIVPLIVRGKSIGTLAVASTTPHQYAEPDVRFLQEVANQVALAVENMKSYEELADLSRRSALTAERYRTLLEINNAIISNLTQEALLHTVCQALQRLVTFDRVALALHEPAGDLLRLVAFEGPFRSERFKVGDAFPRADSHFGWAFDHQRPLVRGDLEAEAEFSTERWAAQDGIRSICAVPLIVRGESIGVVNLASRARARYSEADAAFLQDVANQIALAVGNMKAYEEIAALKARLERENTYLQEEIRREHNFIEMVGNSPALLAALRKVEQVAATDSTVLISGETGTGKELIARAIHGRSARKGRPLVKVNCAAISAGLVESELFGHVKGAFTGALERRIGRFELADRGTIFLDEVGELPAETQVKLLRVLQEQEFEPVGSSRTARVNVRVIAATNRNLQEAVQAGRFRADLFYRLNVFPLAVPALRERRSDIPLLVMFLLGQFGRKFGKRIETVPQETMDRLVAYSWPGNIRELQNVIERAAVLCPGPMLELDHDLLPVPDPGGGQSPVPAPVTPGPVESSPGGATLEAVERAHILATLERTGWLIEGPRGAAKVLGLHPNTLRSRMEKLGIKRSTHGAS